MARGGITFADVDRAARYLQGQGRNPTVDAIREYLGTGSRTTLAELLRQWKAQQAEGSAGNLPQPLLALVNGLWENLQSQAEGRIQEHQNKSDQENSSLKAQLATAKTIESQLKQELQQIQLNLESEQQAHSELKRTMQQSEKIHDQLQSRYEVILKQLDNAKQENQRLHHLATQIQANLEHYQQSIQKQQFEQNLAQEKQQAAYHQEVQQLKTILEQTKTQFEQNEKELAIQELQSSQIQADFDKLATQHQALLTKHQETEHTLIQSQTQKEFLEKQSEKVIQELIVERQLTHSLQQQVTILTEKLERTQQDWHHAKDKIKALHHEKLFLVQEKAQLEGAFKQLQTIDK